MMSDEEESAMGIPEGAPIVIPRLVCRDPAAEIDFITHTFGAAEGVRRPGADGEVVHAMLTLGPAMIMVESEWPAMTNRAPALDGSSPVVLHVYVEDVDGTVERAVAVGARVLLPATDQFWGDRTAWIMDPSGHVWTVATRIEETTEEERQARLARLHAASAGAAGRTPDPIPDADRR
jgi:PhnB protein